MKNLKAIILVTIIMFFFCCGKSDSENGNSIKISGNLGASYIKKSGKLLAPTVDKIWVTPLFGGDPNKIASANMGEHIQLIDLVNGGFSVEVNSEVSDDWLILLIDSSQTLKKDQVLGYVTMGYGSETMLKIPAGNAETGEISLGELNDNGNNEAVSSNTAETNESFFNLTPESLLAMAKTDDMLKAIKNIYVNYDSVNKTFYLVMPIFNFKAGSITDLAAGTPAAPLSIVAAANRMYHFNIKTNAGPFTAAEETTGHNPPATITLNPPSNVSIGSWDGITITSYGPAGIASIPNTYGYVDRTSPNTPVNEFILGYTYFSNAIGAGYWELFKTTELLCTFDVSQAFSVDSSDHPKIFVPVPSLTLDASNNIEKITIAWYMYDSDSLTYYTEVTDTSYLANSIAGDLYLQIFDNDNTNENISVPVTQTEITSASFTGAHNADTLITNAADNIVLNYVMNGVTFRFVWTK